MLLYAKDEEGTVVPAQQACRGKDYQCVECKGDVRLRGGPHRQRHFFHLQSTRVCTSRAKSLEHLQTQLHIIRSLPKGQAFLEASFPKIARIADVFWKERGIVFEVQCSPLAVDEFQARNRDYRSLGLEIVWIFHDKRYNGNCLSAVEMAAETLTHYYTNIDASGQGTIYDQYSWTQGTRRLRQMGPLPVNLAHPQKPNFQESNLKVLQRRLRLWPLHFQGDLLDVATCTPPSPYILKAQAWERAVRGLRWRWLWEHARFCLGRWLLHPYRLVFRHYLEKACRY